MINLNINLLNLFINIIIIIKSKNIYINIKLLNDFFFSHFLL
jgi:hypothetical protein